MAKPFCTQDYGTTDRLKTTLALGRPAFLESADESLEASLYGGRKNPEGADTKAEPSARPQPLRHQDAAGFGESLSHNQFESDCDDCCACAVC